MKRRANVGVGVEIVKGSHKARQKVITGKFNGAKLLTGWKKKINDYRRGISKYNEFHHTLKGIHVKEKGICNGTDKIYEPINVRNIKKFVKGNIIVKDRVHGHEICGIEKLGIIKKHAEYGPIKKPEKMLIVLCVKFAVLYNGSGLIAGLHKVLLIIAF